MSREVKTLCLVGNALLFSACAGVQPHEAIPSTVASAVTDQANAVQQANGCHRAPLLLGNEPDPTLLNYRENVYLNLGKAKLNDKCKETLGSPHLDISCSCAGYFLTSASTSISNAV